MDTSKLLERGHSWNPFEKFGLHQAFFNIDLEVVFTTWFAMMLLFFIAFLSKQAIKKEGSLSQFLLLKFFNSFTDLIFQTVGKLILKYYLFVTTLFLFIICLNWISLIPGLEEPTSNINTTVALGLTAFFYVQKELFLKLGFKNFIKKYFAPFNLIFPLNYIVGTIMFPLKFLGEFASVISMSFRLFGNIFGGFIIASIYYGGIGNSIILNILGIPINFAIISFFVIFEGFLQAFVFSMLAITNIGMAIQSKEGH